MNDSGHFTISLSMHSDWHVGTGTGIRGYVDRLVRRDADPGAKGPAAPIVPAKTLVGVWRDSCEVAAHALDGGEDGVWHEWCEFLFGGQYATGDDVLRPAALVLEGPLRLPGRLTRLLRDKPLVAWATTFRKPGVAIDPKSGTAAEGKLWFSEMARAGLTLRGRGRIDGFPELDQRRREAAVLLLEAGARLLEGIGGKRRRGAGRCSLSFEGVGLTTSWTSATLAGVPEPPMVTPYEIPTDPALSSNAGASGWERMELIVTVEEPILAATTVSGNVTSGTVHVPGWCLMPEVVRRLGGSAHALVRTGDLVVTAAMPLAADGSRTLPVPRALVQAKGGHEVIGNRLAGHTDPGKPCRDGYVVPESAEIVKPPSTVRMHNTIHDQLQRPIRAIGGIYVYRALAAGTVLRGEVRVRAGLLAAGWEERLVGRWRIGRSSKDDYGQARVEARPVSSEQRPAASEEPLRVWLLSDLLVRDLRLRPSTDLNDVARALERALSQAGAPDVRLEPLTRPEGEGLMVAVGAHRTESWHRGWRLPRATLYGLAAGSCLTFRVIGGPIGPDVLAELRMAGVGERRAEGFGQVELDHGLLTRPVTTGKSEDRKPGTVPAVVPLLGPDEQGHAEGRIFERAAWRSEIRRRCDSIRGVASRRTAIIPSGVSGTQLNALRAIVREPSFDEARARLQWLTRSKAGRPDWPETAVSALDKLLSEPDEVWKRLDFPETDLVVTADGAESLRQELRAEAVRVLIDSCLAAHGRAEAARESAGGGR
jgi:CRISPR-associated protein Csx10